jgi:UPF0716 protein FxsA
MTNNHKGSKFMAYLWRFTFILFVLEMVTFGLLISKIGFFMVFILWLLSAIMGGYMVRHGGISTLMTMMSSTSAQKPAIEGIFILIAGILFIFPGFISDFFAIMVLIPFVQPWIKALLRPYMTTSNPNTSSTQPYQDGIIEGDFVVVEENISIIPPKDSAKD